MKAYKDYMDRIKLDEQQHRKLLEAVKAAERNAAPLTADPAEDPAASQEPETKIRRFPRKIWGVLASAAAVAVLVFTVNPDNNFSKKTAELTFAYADVTMSPANTTAPEALPTTTDGISKEESIAATKAPAATVMTEETGDVFYPEATEATATKSGRNEAQPYSEVITCSQVDFGDKKIPFLDEALCTMTENAPDIAPDVTFIYHNKLLFYNTETGALSSEKRYCLLSEADKTALNALLAGIETGAKQ